MKTAIYAGTFDPITNGHLDVLERSLKIFDKIIVAVSEGPKKTLFSTEERVAIIKEITKTMENVEVESFSGLLVDYVKQKESNTVIRGLRVISDFDYEFQMALANRKLSPDIDTLFIMTSEKYSFLSSSTVKEIAKNKGNVSCFVPKEVEEKLKGKF